MNFVSDRNLLFGILALQMEFVAQAGLVAAMNAWTLQKQRSMGELLVELGYLQSIDREYLEVMVDRYVERHGGRPGKCLASLSSVSSIAVELCDVADSDVQQSLEHCRVGSNGAIGSISSACVPDDEKTLSFESPLDGHSPQHRYQVLRPHAEGALGRVWIAVDRELNREVAFKKHQATPCRRPK